MSRLLVLMLTIAFTCQSSADEPPESFRMRTWTDQTGRYSVEARFSELSEGNVRLERKNGETVELPLERLSEPDQQYIENTSSIVNIELFHSELRLLAMRMAMLENMEMLEMEHRQVQSDMAETQNDQSKEMVETLPQVEVLEAQLQGLENSRSQLHGQLALNRLSINALYAPPNVNEQIDEAEAAPQLSAVQETGDTETIRTVGQLRAAADHLLQIGKSDSAATISREADLLEEELEEQ